MKLSVDKQAVAEGRELVWVIEDGERKYLASAVYVDTPMVGRHNLTAEGAKVWLETIEPAEPVEWPTKHHVYTIRSKR